VQDVRGALAVVGIQGAPLVLPARAVARVTLLEDGGDLGAGLGEFFVGDCAGVVDDLCDVVVSWVVEEFNVVVL